MDDNYIEQRLRSEIESLRTSVNERLAALETPTSTAQNLIASPNYIVNSHPEWSKKAWTTAGVAASTVDDDNRTCYNWYYQTRADNTQDLSASGGIIADGHTGFAALNAAAPIWDQVNSRFFLGGTSANYDIACPLSKDFVFPGHKYYVYFETITTDETVDLQDAEFYCGFWDNTSTQRKWIQGSDFTPTTSVYGTPGSRNLKYKILASTDGGDQILSTELSIANAPATMSQDNHVRLYFTGAPGFILFEIYRYDGITYRKVGTVKNSIDLQFFDMQENAGSLETGWPTISSTRPLAIKTTSGLLGAYNEYVGHTMVIQVPTTYNRSNTTNNQQWFRFGLTGAISKNRGLGIRRIMVSEGYGPWVRSQNDLSSPQSSPSAQATFAQLPGGTYGGDVSDGPDNDCVLLNTLVEVITRNGGTDVIESIPMSEVQKGMNLVCGTTVAPVLKVREGIVQETYTIYTKRGFEVTCTGNHRLITSRFDRHGTPSKRLKIGDKVMTSENGVLAQDEIEKITLNIGEVTVKTVTLPSPHLFVTNGIISHNKKAAPGAT